MHFLKSLFASIPSEIPVSHDFTALGKENMSACIRLVDKISAIAGLLDHPDLKNNWQRMIESIFTNSLAAKTLNYFISEGKPSFNKGYLTIVNQIVNKAMKFSPNSSEDK